MCFIISVCVSVVSCRKIALTLTSSCDLFPIDTLIRLSVFVHAHMHICVCVNIRTNFCLCIFMCVHVVIAVAHTIPTLDISSKVMLIFYVWVKEHLVKNRPFCIRLGSVIPIIFRLFYKHMCLRK